MSSEAKLEDALRKAIIAEPDAILDDKDVMRALVAANERLMGGNIVDLRGVAMERLESRLDRLEDTHRNVIAAAYENLAGTNQIHRAVLRLLDAATLEDFLRDLNGDVAGTLRVDAMTLVLETTQDNTEPALAQMGEILTLVEPGFVDSYITEMRGGSPRQVTLRPVQMAPDRLYGDKAAQIRSEACLKLDLGPGRLPGLLVLGSGDPTQFTPQHGTDLLGFFGGVFERSMRRWLS
ncbi:DUF484 family protein [Rhodobacteraceae bacterium F11138]|nr:DUF484 family protein [Rhodobacteraceae bacterium F11138]